MILKAIDLFNNLKEYNEEDLKLLDIVIELGRSEDNSLGKSEYASIIENYPSQIRIVSKIN